MSDGTATPTAIAVHVGAVSSDLVETFTGTNGDPWNPAIWTTYPTTLDGSADIQSNQGRLSVIDNADYSKSAMGFSIPFYPNFDAYAEVTIPDVNIYNVTFALGSDVSVGIYPSGGYIVSPDIVPEGFAIANGDTVKIRILVDDTAAEAYLWITGSQPPTPQLSWTCSPDASGSFSYLSAWGYDGAFEVFWDNVSISHYELPAPTVTGTVPDGEAFPGELRLVARVTGPTYTIAEPFTGTNGDPWDPAIWNVNPIGSGSGDGSTVDIQNGKGRILVDNPGYADAFILFDVPRLFHLDAYAEVTIIDASILDEIAFAVHRVGMSMNPNAGTLTPFSDGVTSGDVSQIPFSVADGDTVKIYFTQDGTAVEVYVWITGSQPGSPTAAWSQPVYAGDPNETNIYIGSGDGTPGTVLWDNILIHSYDLPAVVTGENNVEPSADPVFVIDEATIRHGPFPGGFVEAIELVRHGPFPPQ